MYISFAVSTLIKFTPVTGSKFVSPEIKVVSKPLSLNDLAISYPCLPLDLLVINLTGSIYSRVGPAVTSALNYLFFSFILKYDLISFIISFGSVIFPFPNSPQAMSPISGPIILYP